MRAEVQNDGNFVLYTADKPVWHTDTKGKKNVKLVASGRPQPGALRRRRTGMVDAHRDRRPPPPEPQAADQPTNQAPLTGPSWKPPRRPRGGHREPARTARTYTVVSGDTLWAIAERFYGDGNKYQVIADASGVPNPDLIYPARC